MAHLLHRLRRGILVAALALAGFAALAPAAPAAHATLGPSLSLTGQGGGVYVSGTGFTPGVTVRVEVMNSSMTTVGSIQNLTPQSCYGYLGGCFATVLTAGFTGSAWVTADQAGSATIWAQTTIYQDPYITAYTEPGPYSSGVVVSGSGYTPGASVTVQVSQLCGVFCWKVLSTQTVTASGATQSDADYGLIYAGGLDVPAHSGTVYVSTSGGAPSQSNVVWLSIP
jgi:hypothetical protein